MSQNKQSPDDELRQLLRETSGASPAGKPRGAARPTQASAPADLRSLLSEGGSGSPQSSRRESWATEESPAHSLQDLLRPSSGEANKTQPAHRTASAVKPAASLNLDQALREAHGQSGSHETSRQTATPPRQRSSDLGQALQDNHFEQQPVEPDATAPGFTASPWFARAGVALIVLLVIGLIFMWPERQLDGPPGTLQSLVKAVEQHRQKTGSFPEQLAKLDGFPKDAVEWQARHWNARDARGRTEIIWMPNGSKHYSIVLRKGAEIWVYQDKEGKSRLVAK